MDYFNEVFLPNIKAATVTYGGWRKRYPGEVAKWDAYLEQVQVYKGGPQRPAAPALSTRFGKALVAAAEEHVSVTDLGAYYPPPDLPPTDPKFTTNITDGQNITLPFTWTASTDPPADSMQFWSDGNLLVHDTASPFSHDLTLSAGSHDLGLCAWHGGVRTCYDPQADGSFATVTISGSPPDPPPTDYDYRFASFHLTNDQIAGTLNRFQPYYSWWVPGRATGTAWPDGGGVHEITTALGPGIKMRTVQGMDYPPARDSRLARYAWKSNEDARPPIADFREQRHVWEWTWFWPSTGNPGGWCPTHNTGEGLTFATTISGTAYVGNHLFLDRGISPLRARWRRITGPNTWTTDYSPAIPADTYVHFRVEIFWSASTAGYIRVFHQIDGQSETQFSNYSGVTYPSTHNVWAMYMNVRTPREVATSYGPAWPHPNELHCINHRLTVL